jgi:type IV secretory pathway TraG/TraD family ATPase VirD4
VTPARAYGADGRSANAPGQARVSILEGATVQPTPPVAGSPMAGQPMRAVLAGPDGALRFDDAYLSKHVLFLGGIGTGKTNAMMQLVQALRNRVGPDDVFVIFDTKGDFLREFYRPGDAVITSDPGALDGGVVWNLFRDLLDQDPAARSDQIYEIASTVFSDELSHAGQNLFFAAAARDIFAAAVEAMSREDQPHSNADLRTRLEGSRADLRYLLDEHSDLAGSARYLEGDSQASDSILAFLQQTLNKSFSSAFRLPGDFSAREFVRGKRGRALFIEYDIAIGSRLLPVYRVLMDMAIKEALSLGRLGAPGSVFFVLDEFALLPQLAHVGDGINFGRSLGLKFIVGTQNVNQVLSAYGSETGQSILSGFGTVLAFRLMDDSSRDLVRQRFGANRKQITTYAPVRSEGVQQVVVNGHVVEDWALSNLTTGRCIVSLPEGPPFFFAFGPFRRC